MTEKQDETCECPKTGSITYHSCKKFKAKNEAIIDRALSKLSKKQVSEIARKTLEETGYLPKNHSPQGDSGSNPRQIGCPPEDTPSGKLETDASEPEGTSNLSEKILITELLLRGQNNNKGFIHVTDVKEAIRKLKEEIDKHNINASSREENQRIINKIFGSLSNG